MMEPNEASEAPAVDTVEASASIWTADVRFTITVCGRLEAADEAQMGRLLEALGPDAVFNDPAGFDFLVEGVTYTIEDDGEIAQSPEEAEALRVAVDEFIAGEGY